MFYISATTGVVFGFLAAKMLFLQYLTLLPWGIAGLFIGYFSKTKIEAIKNGLAYGFLLGFVFMAAVYQGSASFNTRIPFFTLLGIVSAICGTVLSIAGYFLKKFHKGIGTKKGQK